MTVLTPESKLALPPTEPQRPAKLAGQYLPLNLERALMLADLLMQLGNKTAPNLQATLPPVSEKCVPGLKEVLKVCVDGVMALIVCGSGPAVAILSHRNSDEGARAVRQRFLDFSISSTYGLFRPTNAGALELNAVTPHVSLPSSRLAVNQAGGPVAKFLPI